MEKLELVELVREKTGVSYGDAKEALDASGDDLLDAIVWLEDQGRSQTRTTRSSTGAPGAEGASSEMRAAQSAYERASETSRRVVAGGIARFFSAVGRALRRSLDTKVVSYRDDRVFLCLPLPVAVVGEVLWVLAVLGSHSLGYLGLLGMLALAGPFISFFYLIFVCHIERPEQVGAAAADEEVLDD